MDNVKLEQDFRFPEGRPGRIFEMLAGGRAEKARREQMLEKALNFLACELGPAHGICVPDGELRRLCRTKKPGSYGCVGCWISWAMDQAGEGRRRSAENRTPQK